MYRSKKTHNSEKKTSYSLFLDLLLTRCFLFFKYLIIASLCFSPIQVFAAQNAKKATADAFSTETARLSAMDDMMASLQPRRVGEVASRADLQGQNDVDRGIRLFNEGAYADAVEVLGKVIEDDAADVRAIDYFIRAQDMLTGKPGERPAWQPEPAIKKAPKDETKAVRSAQKQAYDRELARMTQTSRAEIDAILTRGEQAYQQHEYARALDLFEQALVVEPQNEQALLSREKSQEALSRQKAFCDGQMQEAKTNYTAGAFDKARDILEVIVKTDPTYAEAATLLGTIREESAERDQQVAKLYAAAKEALDRGRDADAVRLYDAILALKSDERPARSAKERLIKKQNAREKTVKRHLENSVAYCKKNAYAKAQQELRNVLAIDPGNAIAQKYLPRIQQMIEEENASRETAYQRALACYREGDYDHAEEAVSETLQQDPAYRDARVLLDKIRSARGKRAKQLSGYLAAAESFYQKGRYQEAAGKCKEILEILPQHPQAGELLQKAEEALTHAPRRIAESREKAEKLFSEKKYAEAVAEIDQALVLDPENNGLRGQRDMFTQALEKEQTREQDLFERAQQAYRSAAYKEARRLFEQIRSSGPRGATATNYLSRIEQIEQRCTVQARKYTGQAERYYQHGAYQLAEEAAKRALALCPDDKSAHDCLERARRKTAEQTLQIEELSARGTELFLKGHYEEAIDAFSAVLALDEKNGLARDQVLRARRALAERTRSTKRLWAKGRQCLKQGKLPAAQKIFEEILSMNPGDTKVLQRLEQIKAAQERVREQIQMSLQQARDALRAEQFPGAVSAAGAVLRLDGGHEEAARIKESAERRIAEKQARIDQAYTAGKAAYARGNYPQAEQFFRQMIELDPAQRKASTYLRAIARKKQRLPKKQPLPERPAVPNPPIGQDPAPLKQERSAPVMRPPSTTAQEKPAASAPGTEPRPQEIVAHLRAGRYRQAIEEADTLLKKDPENTSIRSLRMKAVRALKKNYWRSGIAFFKRESFEAAVKEFETVLSLDPADVRAKEYLEESRKKAAASPALQQHGPAAPVAMPAEKANARVSMPVAAGKGPLSLGGVGSGILSLDDCIAVAVKNSLKLKISKEQLDVARVKLQEAERGRIPKGTLKLEYTSGKFSPTIYRGRQYSAEVEQTIYDAGEVGYTIRQAQVHLAVTQKDYDRIYNELVLEVKKTYYGQISSHYNLVYQQETFAKIDALYKKVEAGYSQGVIPRADWMKIESLYKQAFFQLTSAEDDLGLARLMLKQAMNVDPAEQFDLNYAIDFAPLDTTYDECLRLAFENRDKIIINQMLLEYYEYERLIAQSKIFPRVTLAGSLGKGGEAVAGEKIRLEKEWFLGLRVKVPLGGNTLNYLYQKDISGPTISSYKGAEGVTHGFQLGLLDDLKPGREIKESAIYYLQAQDDIEKGRKEVTLEVREAFYNFKKAILQLETGKSKVAYQESETLVVKTKMESGDGGPADYIDALIKLASEKYSYIDALTSYFAAIATLDKAIGLPGHFSKLVTNRR